MRKALFSQIFHTLQTNRLRSFLTMFGIAWGVLSIILMTSAGEGFRVAQQESLDQLGDDIMIIWGGRTSRQAQGFQAGRQIRLEYADYEVLQERARLLRYVSPEIIRNDLVAKTTLNYGSFSTRGVLPDYQAMRAITVEYGRLMNPLDNEQGRAVCVIGDEVNNQIFGGKNSVGATFSLHGHPFTVIGIMPHKELNNTYQGQDHSAIFIPYRTMRQLFSSPGLGKATDRIDNLIASPLNHSLYEEAEKEVRALLAKKWYFDPDDDDALSIWNTGRQAEMMDIMLRSMQWFLGTVGLITLLLGALGVVNIMLVSVRERTGEIGLRKSLGARRRDILGQFFCEALALTLLAGLMGLALGYGICLAINQLPLPELVFAGMLITPTLLWLSLGLLTAVGIVAALYPAYLAAELDPIEALRFESN